VSRIDLCEALRGLLDWRQRQELEELAPERLEVPTGSRIAIDYADPAAPILAVRLQEVFGWTETPRISRGRVPLTLHLLSPAYRPVQVTQDLRGFWSSGYFEVRRELRARYPRHSWPENPLTAPAVRGPRKRR
jgi:ATP-dependent helicase HrpB